MENLTFLCKKVWLFVLVAISIGFSYQHVYASSVPDKINFPSSASGVDPVLFAFNCIDGQPGDTICIPVTVENFSSILIAQFEIIWDHNILDYIETRNYGLSAITTGDFNLSGPNALKFIPFFFDPFNGENLPDGAVLFEVCFRIIGTPGTSSTITISPYFEFEVVAVDGEVPADSIPCDMMVNNAVDLVGFLSSCGPAIAGGNGGIEVTAYGGTAPYTITWVGTAPGGPVVIPAEGGSMVLNVPAGNYDVTITDALGTQVTYNIDVDPLQLGIGTELGHPSCYKFENGTIEIKPIGGSAPYSFTWESLTDPTLAGSGFIRNASDSSLVTSLPDGSYKIFMRDDNGCESEITVVLNDNPFVFTVNGLQNATCNGSEDGVIDITITGGTPDVSGNYTVTIKPNFEVSTNSVSIGLLDPGTYSITIADEVAQCDTVWSFTIGATNIITATVMPVDVLCAGGTNGSVSVRGLTNGVPGMSYSYTILNSSNGIETSATGIGGIFNYSPLAPGNYSVVVQEGNCLSDTIPFTISEPLPFSVSVGGTTIDDCLPQFETGSAWFNITNGEAPYMLDAGSGFQDVDTLFDLNAGNYIITVTDANGCTATAPFQVFDGDDNEKADITFQIDGTPCEGGTITLLYQGSTNLPPGSQVNWNNGNVGPTMTIEESGTLFVDLFIFSIHCMLNDTVIINCEEVLEVDITVIDPICNDEAVGGPYTGTVIVDTANAVGPVTWIWSFPDTTTTGTYSGLSPGKYYVTVTDALDSMVVDSFEITAPPPIHYNFTQIDSTSCAGVCDGSVMVGALDGDPSLDFFLYWTNGVPMGDTGIIFLVEDLCEGVTEFSISQDGVCFFAGEVEIFSPEPIEIDLVDSNNPTCYGYTDGSLEVVGVGGTPGYTYSWEDGPGTPLYSGIGAGEYFVTATDSEGCTAVDSFTLSQPDSLIASIDLAATLNLSCGGTDDGSVTVAVIGGNTGGYTFDWNPDVSSIHQAVNLAAGEYLITVTDPMGCSDTTAYTLTSPEPIVVDWPEIAPPACAGEETVLQIDSVTGGSGTYSFNVNGGNILDINEPVFITAGFYSVNVFDDRGCVADTTFMVTEPNPILVSIGPEDPIIDLGDSVFISGTVDQSDLPIEMTLWTSEVPVGCDTCAGTWVFNVLPTLYTWTVTDENGCQGSASILVGVDFDRDVFIPNVITPNNDGRNDEFKIYTGPGVTAINYFHIFDRWGNLVHSQSNLLPSTTGAGLWDGTFDGEELNPGVYVYVAEVQFIDNNTKLIFKGDVTIIK